MKRIIIASHHQLAFGMKQTLSFLTGYEPIYELSAYVDGGDIVEQMNSIMSQVDKEDVVLIFTDILGGSVTQKFFPYCSENIHVICGMNLPLVISMALAPEETLNKDTIQSMIQEARDAMVYVNEVVSETDEDDE